MQGGLHNDLCTILTRMVWYQNTKLFQGKAES